MQPSRLFALSICSALVLLAAEIGAAADPSAAEIDALFADYDRTNAPGCALGVIRDGAMIHARGYGMANLEFGIANSPLTVFRTGSVGKQFTAMAIALLAEEGTIALDEPLSKRFPEFPEWADRITIRHLVHHTSGIRDYLTLTWLAGMGDEAYYTDEFAIELLARQKNLNFEPGDDDLYSNSGYLLLAHVVKRATGKTLREWAAANIFEPLGMTNTHFHDDHTHIVPNRADGYVPADDGFKISMTTLDIVGDGGVYTTVEDLLRWDRNFYDNKLGKGGSDLIETVTTPGERNDGEPMHYAFGLAIHDYRGLPTVAHSGGFVGFRADSLRFPEQRFSVFVLCNRADAAPARRGRQVAELFLGDQVEPLPGKPSPADQAATQPVEIAPADLERLAGHYWTAEDREFEELVFEGGSLYLFVSDDTRFELVPASADDFVMTTPWWVADLSFETTATDGVRLTFQVRGRDEPGVFERFEPRQLSPTEAQAYAGVYYSDELDVDYVIEVRDGSLVFGIDRAGDHPLTAKFDEIFASSDYGLFDFERDSEGRVVAFKLDAGRVRALGFIRRPRAVTDSTARASDTGLEGSP